MPIEDMEFKTYRMSLKDLDDEGQFRGYLSVFDNVDHGGDLVEKGAFRRTLRATRAFPLLWGHSSDTPSHVIGTFGGQEDNHGLLVDGEFFMDQAGGREAYGVVKRLKEKGSKVGLSIGYKAEKFKTEETEDGKIIRRLKEIQLFEGSITLFPMNDMATVQAIKAGLEGKPSADNHVCTINDGDYVRYRGETRKHNGKPYTVRYGIGKDGSAEENEYFYPVANWTAAEAKAHCKAHDGRFSAATGKEMELRCASCGATVIVFTDQPDGKALVDRDPAQATPGDDPPEREEAETVAYLKSMVRVVKSYKEQS